MDFNLQNSVHTLDTAEATSILAYSQQNVNAMCKRGTLTPVAAEEKYGLYLKV